MSDSVDNIKQQYRNSLPDKSAALEKLAQQLTSCLSECQEMAGELRDFTHKLAGSTGMYGFDQLHSQSKSLLQHATTLHAELDTNNTAIASHVKQLSQLIVDCKK
ncbi:MAG: hypothetical protein AAF197_11705 [Pseudomonadota bacterium]